MADVPVSPTGKPLVPASVVPVLVALAAVAVIVAGVAEAGLLGAQSPLIAKLAEGASVLCAILLGVTPGMRMKPSAEQLAAASQAGAVAAAKVDGPAAAVAELNKP